MMSQLQDDSVDITDGVMGKYGLMTFIHDCRRVSGMPMNINRDGVACMEPVLRDEGCPTLSSRSISSLRFIFVR